VAKQKEKDRKATAEKVRQAEMLQVVHARAMAEALAKQAAVHGSFYTSMSIGSSNPITSEGGCILAPIPSTVPSKREVNFGGGSFYTSMSIGSSNPITSRAITMMSPFQSGGASFNWSATNFVEPSRT
jgi:hypothetical protein